MSATALSPYPTRIALLCALALVLSACAPADEEATPPAAETPATAAAPEAAPAADALAGLDTEELRQRAVAALRDQRLHSPAGDNAMEYYLAIRERSPQPDVRAESALIDLLPYALIASEQAINADQFAEAERLLALMTRADAEAPALPRIREAILAGRNAQGERQRLAAERTAAAAREPVAAAPAPLPAAPTPALVAQPVEQPPPPVAVEPTPQLAATPVPPPVAAPAAARTGPPRPLSTPQPPYPREAARTRQAGTVVVQFTIGADGQVGEVVVLRSRPRGVFDESVVETVSTWRFEAPGEPVTLVRTFDFRM